MKNSLKKCSFCLCPGAAAAASEGKEKHAYQGFKRWNNPVWLGWKEKACNRSRKLVTWSSLMSNNPVLRGRKERACNPAVWACCWPCGLVAGLVGLLLALQALWACLLACFFFYSFSFNFNTSLHLKHNIKFRLYKIKMIHVNKFFLYNVMK